MSKGKDSNRSFLGCGGGGGGGGGVGGVGGAITLVIICSFEHFIICRLQSPSFSLCTLKPARKVTGHLT